MSTGLTEEEMRQALFGSSTPPAPKPPAPEPEIVIVPPAKPKAASKPRAKPLSPKLRVTMNVTKEFEGALEVFVYDANTLSTLTAELDAKNEAKKKKYKYFEVVSIKPIG
ncbi:hypothetical protein M2401_003967 [Pseudomonas sp. JUb42]|jgi:hypothetical protein|uniref:hypothetical protein n=1 Tax=Pseudomonas sp. JUb42 TaxID=2940611 RepID=UPI0021696B57|nr:hypothetical protein [Pseudomonas sp. JUb42]MCS3470217.1 hypothetical protein [Pseudomonas sp. JUb42]